jgi:hypothetical protein
MALAGLDGPIDHQQARKDVENELDKHVSLFLRGEELTALIKNLEAEKVAKGNHHLAYYRARLEVLKAVQVAITEDIVTTAEQMGYWDK